MKEEQVMKRLVVMTAALPLIFVLLPGARVVTGQGPAPDDPGVRFYKSAGAVPEQYLVVLRNDLDPSEAESKAYELVRAYNGTVLLYPYREGLKGFSANMKEQDALALSKDPLVEFVEEIPAGGLATTPPEPTPEAETKPDETVQEETKSDPEESPTPAESGGGETSLVSPLPPTVAQPLGLADNPRYFKYGTETIALLGISGSYLPHIARDRPRAHGPGDYDPVKENCTFDITSGAPARKYQKCVQKLKEAGLNHLQLWVFVNHSVGKLPKEKGTDPATGTDPYPNEQPFRWGTNPAVGPGKKWTVPNDSPAPGTPGVTPWAPVAAAGRFDDQFFANLKSVVQYCQTNGIIVGVVLFDPWQGALDSPGDPLHGEPTRSAWYAPNNWKGLGFTDRTLFVMGDDDNVLNVTESTQFIDKAGRNRVLRNLQVELMTRAATELSALNNFYWVLANEPDIDGRAYGRRLINWHKYMANKLYDFERTKLGNRHHLIAANLSTNAATEPVINSLIGESKIDIINGHYVRLKGGAGPIDDEHRFAAVKLLRTYNNYDTNGAPTTFNLRRWGFNEGHPTGYVTDPLDTADGVRVEAWEFMLNGGALFDHLSYKWANPGANVSPDDPNDRKSADARKYLSYLSGFLSPIRLDYMRRMVDTEANRFIATPPTYAPSSTDPTSPNYDSAFWAAMSQGNKFLLYMHRSTYKNIDAGRYQVYTGSPRPGKPVVVQNLGAGACFNAEWFYPDGKPIDGLGGVEAGALKRIGNAIKIDTRSNPGLTTKLNTPKYRHDIVLRITRLSPIPLPQPCP